MTFAPKPLTDLATFVVKHGAVNLGVVGDTKHVAKGFSYHLGSDDLQTNASSAELPRDKAGLSKAASAIDIGKVGGNLAGLQTMSKWLVAECLAGAPDTHDIREIIFSADGAIVSRWDGKDGSPGIVRTGPSQGDDTHRSHTHISFFRDSESRDKISLFRRYFEEGNVRITAIKGEDWTPTKNASGLSNGVLREVPDRAAPVVGRIDVGAVIRTIAEVNSLNNNWRLTKVNGKALFLLRSDFTPVVQGGDAAVDGKLTDYIARTNG
jgi:hypothetical protein